jgi:hypothetical protein
MEQCEFCTLLAVMHRLDDNKRSVPLCKRCASVWCKARFVGVQQEAQEHANRDPDNQVCILLDSIRFLVSNTLPREGTAEKTKLVHQLSDILDKESDTVTVDELLQWYPKLHTAVSVLIDAVKRYHDQSTLHTWDQLRGK